jgi:FAD/FMN-containing dehydrogenase
MTSPTTIPGFAGAVLAPRDDGYDTCRAVWNAAFDRHPALIARCTSTEDVVAAIRFGRERGLEIGVKCGGHNITGLSVPDDGLQVDLGLLNAVEVDPARGRATVQGGALLRALDRATEPHGLATTAGNVSHTGVGGLTLGGGMGWLARQLGMACDNVEAYTLVTAEGEVVRATATERPDLFWGLRGGGGNFGVVTEFEFRLHPTTGRALVVELTFDAADAAPAMRAWRDLLPDAPRSATLTADARNGADSPDLPAGLRGRPVVTLGYVWVGDMAEARRYLDTLRQIGKRAAEFANEVSYVGLQSIGDLSNLHGHRRYAASHMLDELSDAAIDAFISRGVSNGAPEPDWALVPYGGFQAYGGAIAETAVGDSAFPHRNAVLEFFGASKWSDPGEDAERVAAARRWGAAMAPFASGVYVNSLADAGDADVRRAYPAANLARLAALKREYDPDNVFHLNQNIRPASG